MTNHATPPGTARRLISMVLGLAALITAILCAFALPALHGGPHRVPIGAAGSRQAAESLQAADGGAWDVRLYPTSAALESAVRDHEIAGGIVVAADSVDIYIATAGGPSVANAVTAFGDDVAAQNKARATIHDLVPFTEDDPRGAGLSAVPLSLALGGILSVLILTNAFPGHRRLHIRIAGVLLFSVVVGIAVATVLQEATHSIDGNYWIAALGLTLGTAALSTAFLGLEAFFGLTGFVAGSALMMLFGIPLSGVATGPHWLPAGWAALGQLLPPGAAGSLLRANAFFGSGGAGLPAFILAVWVALGLALALLAGRRARPRLPSTRRISSRPRISSPVPNNASTRVEGPGAFTPGPGNFGLTPSTDRAVSQWLSSARSDRDGRGAGIA